ncbi:MAG: metallophosphoesterase [Lachnospiraceae bacterium]|nr:metallophosphoesterase [Lachnospiraceae bacterium]
MTYELLISRYGLKTTHYTIETDRIAEDIRVVHLTDLHDAVFGKDNSRLIEKVREQDPDVIFFTGDIFNYKQEVKVDKAVSLLKALCGIAPVYFSYGNHEMPLIQNDGVDLKTLFEAAGAVVVERSYVDTEIKGQALRIGGIYGYCLPFLYALETGREDETAFLRDFQDTDRFTCLLCHMPVAWIRQHSLYDYDIDCVFSGHVHGGQIILPFAGGVYGPDMGWFPGKMAGIFETDESTYHSFRKDMKRWAQMYHFDSSDYEGEGTYRPSRLILSTGLGNTDKVPRFNNIPEILVLDIKAKGGENKQRE